MKQTQARWLVSHWLVLSTAALVLTCPAWAQHGASGGGHVGGGFSAPRSFSMSAPASAPRTFSAPSYRAAAPNQLRSSYTSPVGPPPFGGTQPITGNHGGKGWYGPPPPGRPGRGNRPVYGPGAYLIPSYIGYGYGSYGYADDSGYAYQQQDAPAAADLNAQAGPLPPDDTYRQGYADAPERRPYAPQPAEQVPDQPAITLLFKDGRSPQQVQNYAVTRTTVYVFDGARRREIPLDDIDVPQTEKTNRDAGLDFTVPAGAE